MLFFETKRCKEIFEVISVKLSLSSSVNGSQQTSNFFSWQFLSSISHKGNEIFSSNELSIAAQHRKDMRGIEIERTQKSSVGFHESEW